METEILENLNNVNYVSEINTEKENIKNKKNQDILDKQLLKEQKLYEKLEKQRIKDEKQKLKDDKFEKTDDYENENDDKATPIIGKSRMITQQKINSYRELFKDELKHIKIKKNCSDSELSEYLQMMEDVVETGTVNQFLEDSIIQCIKIIEGISTRTKYNIQGLSSMLQHNVEFNKLIKQLFLKYNVFSKIPIEYQLIMIITTTAYIAKCKNDKKVELNEYFNEPIIK